MFRKIVAAVVLIPLLVLLVGFAVANRQAVTVSFDPFDSAHPAYALTLPLFGIVFVVLIAGVVIGGVASWLRQSHWRRATRRLDNEVRALHSEMDSMRQKFAAAEPPPAEAKTPLILPPTVL